MEDMGWVGKLFAERGDTVLVVAMSLYTIAHLGGKAIEHGLGRLWIAAAEHRTQQARWYGLKADELQAGRPLGERVDALEKVVTSLHPLIERVKDDVIAHVKDPNYDRRQRPKWGDD